jgi:hypothetical protein
MKSFPIRNNVYMCDIVKILHLNRKLVSFYLTFFHFITIQKYKNDNGILLYNPHTIY